MPPASSAVARRTRGFMPEDEGVALYEAGLSLEAAAGADPMLEVGTYCGRSAVYLGAAARAVGRVLFTIDHHRGSEENQHGWEHHDPDVVDPRTGRIDTLPFFRRTIEDAGLEEVVVAVVGQSAVVARTWRTRLSLLFLDGAHGSEPAVADYEGWVPHLSIGGLLAIHDVFPDPGDGGRPPYELWCRASASGSFDEAGSCGSLRLLRRIRPGE